MAFADYVYNTNYSVSFQIRLDTDQATLAAATAGASDIDAHLTVSKSSRRYGIHPRTITLKRVVGTGAAAKSFFTRLAICTQAAWEGISVGSTQTVNGVSYTVSSKDAEYGR
jgi:hypothetical protein